MTRKPHIPKDIREHNQEGGKESIHQHGNFKRHVSRQKKKWILNNQTKPKHDSRSSKRGLLAENKTKSYQLKKGDGAGLVPWGGRIRDLKGRGRQASRLVTLSRNYVQLGQASQPTDKRNQRTSPGATGEYCKRPCFQTFD